MNTILARLAVLRRALLRHAAMAMATVACGVAAPLLGQQVVAPEAAPTQLPSAAELVGLAELYGTVLHFHPDVVVDSSLRMAWDSAFANAVESILRNRSGGDWRGPLRDALATLGDATTRVVPLEEEDAVGIRGWRLRAAEGSNLLWLRPDSAGSSGSLGPRPPAPADLHLIVDLRGIDHPPLALPAEIFRWLGIRTPIGSGTRVVRYHGYPSDRRIYGGAYRPFWATWSAPLRDGSSPPGHHQITFLFSGGSRLPAYVQDLRSAGFARVVSDGPLPFTPLVRTLELPSRYRTEVQVGEWTAPTGGSLAPTDLVVDVGGLSDSTIRAIVRALPLAIDSTRRDSLPPIPQLTDPAPEGLPSAGLRVLGAFRLWGAAHWFFPYLDLAEESWPDRLTDAVRGVLASESHQDYALALGRFSTAFHDSHALVVGSAIDQYVGRARPGIGIRVLDSVPIVIGTREGVDGAGRMPAIGDLILAVDEEPSRDRLRRLASITPHSTPQALSNALAYQVLAGPESTSARLRLQDGSGSTRVLEVPRSRARGWMEAFGRRGPATEVFAGQIGYVDLAKLTLRALGSWLDTMPQLNGLVLDVRAYPDFAGYVIAPLISRDWQSTVSITRTPVTDVLGKEWDERHDTFRDVATLIDSVAAFGRRFHGPVIALVDERTQSRGEWTAQLLKAGGATLVGVPTSGVNGDITFLQLPGDLMLRFTGDAVLLGDRTRLQRRGLIPDVLVRESAASIRAGTDPPLARALELLREAAHGPK